MILTSLDLGANIKISIKLIVTIILVPLFVSCSKSYEAKVSDVVAEKFIMNYGVIGISNDCFVTDTKLTNNQTLYLIETSINPTYEEANTVNEIQSCDTYDSRNFKYKYSFTSPKTVNPQAAFVIFSSELAEHISTMSSFDLNHDGIADAVKICYEHESYIFSIWLGNSTKNKHLISIEIFTHFELDPDAKPKCNELDRSYLEMK